MMAANKKQRAKIQKQKLEMRQKCGQSSLSVSCGFTRIRTAG